ncbi:MAG: GNAT family N-acetyltransferase [Promethearchaeota archaeon]
MADFNSSIWYKKYKEKEIEPKDLINIISPGSRIFIGTGCSEPISLTNELVHDKYRWTDCEIIHFLTLSDQKFFSDKYPTRFRHNTLSILGTDNVRSAVEKGKSDFIPIKTSEIVKLLKSRSLIIDICLLQVSPPDKYGFCSLGINVDINRIVSQIAKKVIVQINPQMPYTEGDTTINFDEIDYFVFKNAPLLEFEYKLDDKDREINQKIGNYLSRLIENESTLNIGLGKLSNSIWPFLKNKSDLAIFSEMLVFNKDLISLIKNKTITCKKNIHQHVMTSFILGTKESYDFVNRNPFIKFYSSEFMTDIENIAKNKKLCSIYGTLFVDLSGQITNHLPKKFYGGIGGEHDFVQGSSLSHGGKTIILLPSTNKEGTQSRIVPIVQRGSLSAYDVHYVVTEWGIAYLAGKNVRNRALQLIGISHPKFRKELLNEAKKLHYLYEDQILPMTKDGSVIVFPEEYEWDYVSKNNRKIHFRPVKPTDEEILQRFFYTMDEKSRIFRFLTPKPAFPHEDAQFEVNIDYNNTMVIIGLVGDEDNKKIVASGSYYKDPSGSTNKAEIAVWISNKWQKEGIGFHLFSKLCEIGQEKRISGFFGEVLAENIGILKILKNLPYKVIFDDYGETFEFSFQFKNRI